MFLIEFQPNLTLPATHRGHRFLKSPISGHAEWVDEAFSIIDVSVEVVEADELVAVDAAVAGHPLAAEELADRADRLEGEVHGFVEWVSDLSWS